MNYSTIIQLILKILAMIVMGLILKKKDIITVEVQKGLSSILLNVALPACIINSAFEKTTNIDQYSFIISILTITGIYLVTILISVIVGRFAFLEAKERLSFVNICMFPNTAFLGYPIASELYGAQGMIYAVIYNIVYQVFLVGYAILRLPGQKTSKWDKSTKIRSHYLASLQQLYCFSCNCPEFYYGAYRNYWRNDDIAFNVYYRSAACEFKNDRSVKKSSSNL